MSLLSLVGAFLLGAISMAWLAAYLIYQSHERFRKSHTKGNK